MWTNHTLPSDTGRVMSVAFHNLDVETLPTCSSFLDAVPHRHTLFPLMTNLKMSITYLNALNRIRQFACSARDP